MLGKIAVFLGVICAISAQSNNGPESFACTNEINTQIATELKASHIYLTWAYFFERHDVALDGFREFYSKHSDEERAHAKMLMNYLNKRGGTINVTPESDYSMYNLNIKTCAEKSLTMALQLEKAVTESLKDVHRCGELNNDANLQDFIEANYLQEQVDGIKMFSDLITKLKRAGTTGLGLYMFDKELK